MILSLTDKLFFSKKKKQVQLSALNTPLQFIEKVRIER